MNHSNAVTLETMNEISTKLAEEVDTKIYRIVSGGFKLRKDGRLDQRFKENWGKK